MRYAMLLKNMVIDILEEDVVPSYPPDPQGVPILAKDITGSTQGIKVGYIYNEALDVFSEYIAPPPPPILPTEAEVIEAEMLLSQQEIIANQKSQDEVLAAILLSQQGVTKNV